MRKLVNDGIEVNFKEPDKPKRDVTAHTVKNHKKDLAQHCEKMDECTECKAKVFLTMKGQWNHEEQVGCQK